MVVQSRIRKDDAYFTQSLSFTLSFIWGVKSGVEAIGLTLGVVPIIIYVIEKVEDIRADKSRREFFVNILFEISFLQINLRMLASNLSSIPSDVRDKLLSPEKSEYLLGAWQDKVVVDAMKARLDPGYQAFITTLAMLLELFSDLLDCSPFILESGDVINPKSAYDRLEGIHKAYYKRDLKTRIKFAVYDKRKSVRILAKITECNSRIEKIVSSSIGAPDSFVDDGSKQAIEHPHVKLRPLMHPLYESLGGLWPCDPCECGQTHEARLCMLKRKYKSDLANSNVWFDLYMSLRTNTGEKYCKWLESKLCVALEQEAQAPREVGVRFALPAEPPSPEPSQSPQSPDSFVMLDRMNTGLSGTTLVHSRRRSSATARKKIENLCKTLYGASRAACAPSLLFDGTSIWHVTGTFESRSIDLKGNLVETSLAALLNGQRKLQKREKMILSVILAHSLLDFCESAWLRKDWNKEHVMFFSASGSEVPELRRPYLSTAFRLIDNLKDDEDREQYRIHPNESVLALGILLLEIELNSTIESHRSKDDLDEEGNETVNTDNFTACRTLDEKGDDAFVNTRRAIDQCLSCEFYDPDTMDPSLDDPEFRQAIYLNVIVPLETDLKNGFELTPDNLGL